ncbi:MAG: IS5 family transposase [Candidatus Binatia bacterium]
MWTTENRVRYNRDKLRYPSDVTEEEWAAIAPLIPPARRGGRKRTVNIREVFNGLMYVLSTGCQWRALPKDLPPRSTIFHYFRVWEAEGTLRRIQATLYGRCREHAGRSASPTAGIIDSQSVKSAEKGGAGVDPAGFDAGKQVKGKKRHLLVDTLGLVIHAIVHPANRQDRDGGILLFTALADRFPLLATLFADGAYQGPVFRHALATVRPQLTTAIVTRSAQRKGFVVLPKRWLVERSIAWLNRCRRLAKDFENRTRSALAFVHLASIRLMVRKLCNPS